MRTHPHQIGFKLITATHMVASSSSQTKLYHVQSSFNIAKAGALSVEMRVSLTHNTSNPWK